MITHLTKYSVQWMGLIIFLLFNPAAIHAQDEIPVEQAEKTGVFKDTLDGQFDFSSFLIDSKGFIPIPIIITEPALGNFGGVIALAFMTPKIPPPGKKYVAPDITAGLGMYTANGSWAVGAGRIGSFPKAGIKYRAFAGYASLNLSFYRSIMSDVDQEFKFNIQALPMLISISKSIARSDIYLGLQYVFAKSKVEPRFEAELPDWVPEVDKDNTTGSLGLFGEWDKRNNFFTPDKGAILHMDYSVDDSWTGSDFNYQKLHTNINYFTQWRHNWISGFRFETTSVFGTPAFYLLPSLNMRGVPAARYQGSTIGVLETEQRFDFNRRWSMTAFAGLGKAIMEDESFADAELVYNYGAGFRYLIARVFGLRVGVDVARGPEEFAWYIIFGHNWNR